MNGNTQYKGEFSISYKNRNFNLDTKKYDGFITKKQFSSPDEVFKEIDKTIDFKRDEGAEYKIEFTNRARRKLRKWADAIEGDVEAANILNFPYGEMIVLRNHPTAKKKVYLKTPPTKESSFPIRMIGYLGGENDDHIDITDHSIDAERLFPKATTV